MNCDANVKSILLPIVKAAILAIAVCCVGCTRSSPQSLQMRTDKEFDLDFSGHIQGVPDPQKVDGICTSLSGGTEIKCDIYNGFQGLEISEVTIAVIMDTTNSDPARFFKAKATIAPLTTETVNIKLGSQLAQDTWLKGQRFSHWEFVIRQIKAHHA
jgi:hypothetical protein